MNPCSPFHTITNQSTTSYLDTNLTSYKSYEYTYCAANSAGKTCLPQVYQIVTSVSEPRGFVYFNYRVVENKAILLEWQPPVYLNAPLRFYRVFRDNVEIYKGVELSFLDKTRHLEAYKAYRYEIEVCNQVNCTRNERKIGRKPFGKGIIDNPHMIDKYININSVPNTS